MLKAILRLFPYVRELEDELGRERLALESASRYVDLLEALKDSQGERIVSLEAALRKEEDRAATAFASCARLTVENESLRRRISKETGGKK